MGKVVVVVVLLIFVQVAAPSRPEHHAWSPDPPQRGLRLRDLPSVVFECDAVGLWPAAYSGKLGVDQIDLLLLHQPLPSAFERTLDAYKALETLLRDGKVRAMGVSNFMPTT